MISYGFYLWHEDLITQVFKWTGWRGGNTSFVLLSLTVITITIPVATISYFGFERPLLRLKNRMSWWGGRARARARASLEATPRPVRAGASGDRSLGGDQVLPEVARADDDGVRPAHGVVEATETVHNPSG